MKMIEMAKKMCAHEQKHGHADARIIFIEKNAIVIHAGTRSTWKVCGSNERWTRKELNNLYKVAPEFFE